MRPVPRRRLGGAGEGHARRYLESRGYVFLAANWHCPAGELDLVMRDGDELVFVEVKTRRGEAAGRAEEAVSAAKGRRLLASGEWFLADRTGLGEGLGDAIWRVDLVAVTLDASGLVVRVTHTINAVVANS